MEQKQKYDKTFLNNIILSYYFIGHQYNNTYNFFYFLVTWFICTATLEVMIFFNYIDNNFNKCTHSNPTTVS